MAKRQIVWKTRRSPIFEVKKVFTWCLQFRTRHDDLTQITRYAENYANWILFWNLVYLFIELTALDVGSHFSHLLCAPSRMASGDHIVYKSLTLLSEKKTQVSFPMTKISYAGIRRNSSHAFMGFWEVQFDISKHAVTSKWHHFITIHPIVTLNCATTI